MKDSATIETGGPSSNPNPSYPSKAWTITYSSDARALLPTISKDIHPEVLGITSDLGKSIRDLRPSSRVEAGVVARNIHLRTEKVLSRLGKYTPTALMVVLVFSFMSFSVFSFLDPKLPGSLVAAVISTNDVVSDHGSVLVKVGAGALLKGIAADLRISAAVIDGVAIKMDSGVKDHEDSSGVSLNVRGVDHGQDESLVTQVTSSTNVDRVALLGGFVSELVSGIQAEYQNFVLLTAPVNSNP